VPVYEFLKDRIINGTYGPGEKLNEREIAKLVNVSRTPTRHEIVDVLRGKIKKRPEKIMERHIDYSRKSFLQFYRGFGTRPR
jgi:DNA-binding GntR family transcriptional regulator